MLSELTRLVVCGSPFHYQNSIGTTAETVVSRLDLDKKECVCVSHICIYKEESCLSAFSKAK